METLDLSHSHIGQEGCRQLVETIQSIRRQENNKRQQCLLNNLNLSNNAKVADLGMEMFCHPDLLKDQFQILEFASDSIILLQTLLSLPSNQQDGTSTPRN